MADRCELGPDPVDAAVKSGQWHRFRPTAASDLTRRWDLPGTMDLNGEVRSLPCQRAVRYLGGFGRPGAF